MKLLKGLVLALVAVLSLVGAARSFEIGETDFLLDGKPIVLRCGEIHYARIPRAYWRHRLQMLRAMGCNAVGCYMFWNFHEREPGKFNWEGRADAAAFCRMAQEEGLWVILRPGPYACAEWEGGGAPWWLMADDLVDAESSPRQKGISMRSSDPRWVEPAKRWIAEVGRRLAPLQITKGGPILMVQVENEYGLHGNDTNYIRTLRQATLDAGFEVPLYACNPPRVIQNGFVPELFQAANFGGDPEQRFSIVRQYQPKGPLMCSEYYPAWFDTWGQAHHPPKRDREFFGPIDWMLAHRASFSLYMAHGGTSFGGWTGCRNPFVPNVTSYDYEAPINEHGAANPSFAKFRDRCAKYLNPGETIPPMPAPIPTAAYGTVRMEPFASLDALVTREVPLSSPVYMEQLGQGFGLVSYERDLAADEGGLLSIDEVHDFGYVFLDGQYLGTLDRRHRGVKVAVPQGITAGKRRLQIVLEPMGRINSSTGMEDRKGLNGCVRLGGKVVKGWTARMMPINPDGFPVPSCVLADGAGRGGLSAPRREVTAGTLPTLYRGTLAIPQPQPSTSTSFPADTFIDMTTWTKGIVWVNGHNLGRFWSIGPQQTLYVPGCWLKFGANEVIILDFFGPRQASEVVFREKPILDVLQPETDFNRKARMTTKFVGGTEVASGTFPNTDEAQVVMFEKPVRSTTFTFQARTTYDAKNLASIAEFDLLDRDGNPLTSLGLRVTGVDSEEEVREDGVAENAIDGQVEAAWVTSSRSLPHWIAFETPIKAEVYGFRYTPQQKSIGRIKDWSLFIPARNLQAEIDAVTFTVDSSDSALRFDGYKVERRGDDYIITGARARSEIYARYDEPLWEDLKDGETFVRNPAFETRFLNVNTTERHGIKDYLAATGCNLVQLGRLYGVSFEETLPEVFAALPQDEQERLRQSKRATQRSAAAQVKELADLDVPAYPLLYGCDAMKWNKTLCAAFLNVHPSAKAVNPPQSWEKGILCPSDPETARFIEAFVYEVASNAPYEGIVATFWDDYGLNCHCDRCRANGNDRFGNQVAFAVGCYERACAKAKRKLIVRTWASGAAHWLGDEWVHAPGYGGPTGEPLSVWGKAYANLRPETIVQTKVYNADCQPNAPFSRLLGELNKMKSGNVELAEWQITGQTLGRQWLPASVVDDTAWRMKEAQRRVGPRGGVALYAGGYKNRGYDALGDILNSVNLYAWRELSWNPEKSVTTIYNEWSERTFGKVEPHVIAALKASERAVVASFSPLGLGAPTESNFANNRTRRESLLKYTNRYFLPEGEAALAPTAENIARVLAEKDAALKAVDGMRRELEQADLPTVQKDEMLLRTDWLRAHLTVSRALDGALWRLRYLETLSPTDKEAGVMRHVLAADYEDVRSHAGELFSGAVGRTFSFYAAPAQERQVTLGSPINLARDIRDQAK